MSLPKESIELLLATGRAQLPIHKGDDEEAFFIKPDGNPVGLVAQAVAITNAS